MKNIFNKVKNLFNSFNNRVEVNITLREIPIEKESKTHNRIPEKKFDLETVPLKRPNELSPVEILMLGYADGLPVSYSNFPGYWSYKYESDPHYLIMTLLKAGLLIKETDFKKNMSNTTVKELKELLKEKNLKVSGKKEELIERLIDSLPHDELAAHFNTEIYSLTDEGNEVVNRNSHIRFFHANSNFDISINQADDFKKKNPAFSPRDIAWSFLNKYSMEHAAKGDWGLYRNTRYHLAEVLLMENKYKQALYHLIEVCYFDLSGTFNGFNPDYLHIFEKSYYKYEDSGLYKLYPGILNVIKKVLKELQFSEEAFKEFYDSHVSRINSPFHLFTKDEVFEIIKLELNDEIDEVKKIYKSAGRRYKKLRKVK